MCGKPSHKPRDWLRIVGMHCTQGELSLRHFSQVNQFVGFSCQACQCDPTPPSDEIRDLSNHGIITNDRAEVSKHKHMCVGPTLLISAGVM